GTPRERLQPWQEEVGFEVRVAVVRALYRGAVGEQGVAFVDEQNDIELLGAREELIEALLRFADVFVDHRGEIEPVEIHLQRRGEELGGQGVAGAARPGEESAHAAVELASQRRADVALDLPAVAAARFEVAELVEMLGGRRAAPPR